MGKRETSKKLGVGLERPARDVQVIVDEATEVTPEMVAYLEGANERAIQAGQNGANNPSVPRGFVKYCGRIITAEAAHKEVEKARRRVSRQDPAPQTIRDLFPVLKSERPKDSAPATVAKRAKARKKARKSRRNNRK